MGGKTTRTSDTKVLEFKINSATYGLSVPVILGTARISPNVIDWFDFTTIPHTETTRTGKGGGSKTEHTTYTYTAAVLLGLAEGPIGGVGRVWSDDMVYNSLSALGLTLFNGAFGQSPWSYTQSKYPAKALPYSGLAYVAGVMDLNSSGGLPQLNFEVKGMLRETGDGIDVNPADAIQFICTDPVNGVGFGVGGIDMESLERYRTYCKAADLLITVEATETKKAYEIINEICQATNTIVFWSQNKLKLVPRCDERLERNGVVYEPDNTPLYELDERDFLDTGGAALVEFEREDNAEAYNHVPVEFINRANGYEKEIADGEILSDINRRGRRSKSAVNLPYLRTKERAQYVANLLVAASLYGRNKYSFKLGWPHCLLEPGDFVTIYDPVISPNPIPVIIDEIEESEDGDLDVVAIGRKPGANSGARYATHEADRPSIDYNAPPGDTVATIFDLSPEIANGLAACIAVSGNDTWGGCSVWVSDTGEAYQQIGSIDGPSRHGVLTADLPAGAAIDTVNVLQVQMYSGQLLSGTEADAQNLNTLCWVDGELIAYTTATLTGEKQYNLSYLIRGAYNTPITEHLAGSKFVRLDPYLFKYPFTVEQLGRQIYLKLTSRNMFGVAEQTLDEAEAIPYILITQDLPDVSNIQLAENTYRLKDGTVLSDIHVWFSEPNYLRLSHYNIYYDLNNSGQWKFAGSASSGDYIIKALPQAQTIKVKITVFSDFLLESSGTISESLYITGKDRPPSDVPKLSLVQMGENIKAVIVEPDDPDINCYELRMGSNWGNSIRIKYFTGDNTVFEAPMNGSLVFWVKAIDNSRNLSANATKCAINVVGLKPKNIIFERVEDTSAWQATAGMYRDYWGYWRMQSKERVDDYQTFDQVLAVIPHMVDAQEITLPEIDLGSNVIEQDCYYIDFWGEVHLKSIEKVDDYQTFDEVLALQTLHLVEPKAAMQTLLGINIDWNSNHTVELEIEYRVRVDGDGWSNWTIYSERQFFGRRVQIRLLPKSLDGVTSVVIRGGTIKIDVPDVEDIIENVPIEAVKTKIKFHRKFYTVPKSIEAYTRDLTGKLAANRIDPATITNADCDLEILDDNDNVIAGKLELMRIRGY